jgi:hypothetical protein
VLGDGLESALDRLFFLGVEVLDQVIDGALAYGVCV